MKFCSPEHNPYKVESLQGFFLKKKKNPWNFHKETL